MIKKFYQDHYSIVYGYLLSLCGDPVQAEDLASEAFLKALERIDTYDMRYSPSTWICTIGRNLYINQCKREKREVPLQEPIPCTAPSPEVLYLQKELAQQIITAAKKLPPLQQQVLFMRLEGMPFRSIGLALGKTENWARVTFFRAKSKILEEVEEQKW